MKIYCGCGFRLYRWQGLLDHFYRGNLWKALRFLANTRIEF